MKAPTGQEIVRAAWALALGMVLGACLGLAAGRPGPVRKDPP